MCGRFAKIQVAGGVVQAQSLGRFLLHKKKATVPLYHGGDSDIGFPACVHTPLSKANQRETPKAAALVSQLPQNGFCSTDCGGNSVKLAGANRFAGLFGHGRALDCCKYLAEELLHANWCIYRVGTAHRRTA